MQILTQRTGVESESPNFSRLTGNGDIADLYNSRVHYHGTEIPSCNDMLASQILGATQSQAKKHQIPIF